MSVWSIIVVILCVICMAVSGLVGTLTDLRMVDELNKGRPPEAKFTTIGWRANFELYDVLSEYRRLFPGAALLRRAIWCYVCGFLALTVAVGIVTGTLGAAWLAFAGAFLGWLTWKISSPRAS
jgi:hypothetical protein